MLIKQTKLVPQTETKPTALEESNRTNGTFALQYPPKVHLPRDVYSNSSKSGWSFFRTKTQS